MYNSFKTCFVVGRRILMVHIILSSMCSHYLDDKMQIQPYNVVDYMEAKEQNLPPINIVLDISRLSYSSQILTWQWRCPEGVPTHVNQQWELCYKNKESPCNSNTIKIQHRFLNHVFSSNYSLILFGSFCLFFCT